MGFSGGGSNVLLPHKHDGRVSQDGGELDFNNITQSNSSAGQVFFSNGTALQQLAIGNALEQLRVNAGATAPEWAAAGAGVTTAIQTSRLTSQFSSTSTSYTAVTGLEITLSNNAGGIGICGVTTMINGSTDDCFTALADDTAVQNISEQEASNTSNNHMLMHSALNLVTDGSVVGAYTKVGSGTIQWKGTASADGSNLLAGEIY